MYLIGVDLGSSSVKVALVRADNHECLAVAHHPKTEMKMDAPQMGWAEQNPEDWWSYFKLALQEVLNKAQIDTAEILAIGISYQMHGLVIVDKNQQVLRPAIIWCDSRAVEIGRKAFENIGTEKCLDHFLNSPGNFTASKLKWVKENEPGVFARIDKMMLPGDYLAMKLSGVVQTTVPGLSEGVLWNYKAGKVASEVLDEFEIPIQLIPKIVDTFSVEAKLSKTMSEELGLIEGTPISYRAGDQPNNALSLGVIHADTIAATGGTSGVVYGIVDHIRADSNSRVNGFAHVNHSEDQPRIGILLCINGAGSQYAWLKNQIAESEMTYEEMEVAASKIPIASEGLCILPYGNGSERMLENMYQGASIHNVHFNLHRKAHFYRAALEGIAFSFMYGLEIMAQIGVKAKKMYVGNDNLFQSEIFAQTLSNLAEVDIMIIETTGAVGAAKAAGFGMSYYSSLEEAIGNPLIIKSYSPNNSTDEYKKAYQTWRQILDKQYKTYKDR